LNNEVDLSKSFNFEADVSKAVRYSFKFPVLLVHILDKILAPFAHIRNKFLVKILAPFQILIYDYIDTILFKFHPKSFV
jgi:hypothetical protein